MKLYNINVVNHYDGEPFSFNAVAKYLTDSMAMELAKKYIVDELGEELYEGIEEDLDVLECYAIDEVDGYKVKLVKG